MHCEAGQLVLSWLNICNRYSTLMTGPDVMSGFAGGYSAGYYSYKWAEVLSADAFAAFEEAGLQDDAQVQSVGRRFRDTVLSLGGGADALTVFKQFRGREPSSEALLRHSGLVPSAA